MLLLQLLLFRAFWRAFRPAWYSRALAHRAVLSWAVSALLGFVLTALGGSRDATTNEPSLRTLLSGDATDNSRSWLTDLGDSFLQHAKRMRQSVHLDREHLLLRFVFDWAILAGGIVTAFSSVYYGLSLAGLLPLEIGTSGRLGASIGASIAIFTTAPIAGFAGLGGAGMAAVCLEALDACFVLVLLISVVIRALPTGQAEKLDEVEALMQKTGKALEEAQDEAESRLDDMTNALHDQPTEDHVKDSPTATSS